MIDEFVAVIQSIAEQTNLLALNASIEAARADEALGTESATGWLVSAVEEVRAVADDALDTSDVVDSEFLRGFLKQDDEFTLWLDPHELTA